MHKAARNYAAHCDYLGTGGDYISSHPTGENTNMQKCVTLSLGDIHAQLWNIFGYFSFKFLYRLQ